MGVAPVRCKPASPKPQPTAAAALDAAGVAPKARARSLSSTTGFRSRERFGSSSYRSRQMEQASKRRGSLSEQLASIASGAAALTATLNGQMDLARKCTCSSGTFGSDKLLFEAWASHFVTGELRTSSA